MVVGDIGAANRPRSWGTPDPQQRVETFRDRVVKTCVVPKIQQVQFANQHIPITDKLGGRNVDLVIERPDPSAVFGQHPDQELLGPASDQMHHVRRADTRVEHHDDRDRAHVVVEQHDLLRLPVVEDREVLTEQIGNQASSVVGHSDV